MARSTLARHRTTRLYALRDPETGGGGGGGTGGTGTGGNTGGSGDNGGGGGGSSGTGGSGTGSNGGGDGGGSNNAPNGYPLNTPLEQMNGEQREAYWKHYARTHEQRANSRSDYDEQKALADQYREFLKTQQTPEQRAAAEAEERGRQAGASQATKDRVADALRLALEFRNVTGDDATEAIATANPDAFLTDGKLDTGKVSRYVARWAGSPGAGGGQSGGQGGGIGQGRRNSDGGAGKSVGAGRDLFADRHKSRQPAGSTT